MNLLPALLLGGLLLLALPLLFSGHGGSDTGTNYQVGLFMLVVKMRFGLIIVKDGGVFLQNLNTYIFTTQDTLDVGF